MVVIESVRCKDPRTRWPRGRRQRAMDSRNIQKVRIDGDWFFIDNPHDFMLSIVGLPSQLMHFLRYTSKVRHVYWKRFILRVAHYPGWPSSTTEAQIL